MGFIYYRGYDIHQASWDFEQCVGLNIIVISLVMSMVQELIDEGFGPLHTHEQKVWSNKNTLTCTECIYVHTYSIVEDRELNPLCHHGCELSWPLFSREKAEDLFRLSCSALEACTYAEVLYALLLYNCWLVWLVTWPGVCSLSYGFSTANNSSSIFFRFISLLKSIQKNLLFSIPGRMEYSFHIQPHPKRLWNINTLEFLQLLYYSFILLLLQFLQIQ